MPSPIGFGCEGARAVVEPSLTIAEHFGELLSWGMAHLRAALRQIVFLTKAKSLAGIPASPIDSPLITSTKQCPTPISSWNHRLFETDQHQLVDSVLLVDLPEALQIESQRQDSNQAEQIARIIQSQCHVRKALPGRFL